MKAYEEQSIRNGSPTNAMAGLPTDKDFAKTYPDCLLVVVEKVAIFKNLIEVFYSLLKDKLNISRLTFASGDNATLVTYK